MRARRLAAALSLLVPLVPAGAETGGCLRVGVADIRLPAPQTADTLALPHRLISWPSFEVLLDSLHYREGIDWQLDAIAGQLIWVGPPPPEASTLTVRYRYLPMSLTGSWQHDSLRVGMEPAADAMPPARADAPRAPAGLPAGASLQVGGSETFSLTFGNRRDVNLTQSLYLTLGGQLADSVRVRAVLTDRNLPLQPEGTTTELADLDQVLIELRSPWADLDLGDIQVREDRFQFLAHAREMDGLRLRAGRRGKQGAGAIGRGLGRHEQVEFFGVDGRQGPYALITPGPGEDILLTAGSERIWLDGARLQRGEDADYTIDYSSGEVFFTSRRPITARSEIRAEMQVRRGVFDRNYLLLASSVGDSSGGVSVAWMREQDDPDRSPTLVLGDEERSALREAGDSTTAALDGGIRFVGEGQGPYALVEPDTLDFAVFVYYVAETGEELGAYEVDFADVGEDEGDYDLDETLTEAVGTSIYTFVGRRRGRYLPGRRLPLPESHDVVALRAGGDPVRGLRLQVEGAASWLDRNQLSPRDDGDNAGAALAASGRYRTAGDRVEIRVGYRGVDERFVTPEAIDPAFYHRRWNASTDQLGGRDRRGTVGLRLRPAARIGLDADFERIETSGGLSGRRWHARAQRSGVLHGRGEVWLGRSRASGIAGEELRAQGAMGWRKQLDLEASYEMEDLERGGEGEGYHTVRATAASGTRWPRAQLSLLTEWRWDHERQGGRRQARGLRRRLQAEADWSGERTLAHLIYAHASAQDAGGARLSRSHLADWSMSHRTDGRLFSGEWRGKLTAEALAEVAERLLYVGTDAGHYDSLGHYVGVGDYELYFEDGDSTQIETGIESAVRLSGRPLAWAGGGNRALRAVEASVYARLKLRTPGSAGAVVGHVGQLFSGDAPARDHQSLLRGELSWKPRGVLPSPRARWVRRRGVERIGNDFLRIRRSDRQEIETRWTPRPGLQSRLEVSREIEREGVERSGVSSADEREEHGVAAEVQWRFHDPFSVRGGGSGAWTSFDPTGSERTTGEAMAGWAIDLARRGRVELLVERRWVGQSGGTPGTFLLEREGWEGSLNGSLRPRANLSGTLSLRLEGARGRRTVVTGRMEVRALF